MLKCCLPTIKFLPKQLGVQTKFCHVQRDITPLPYGRNSFFPRRNGEIRDKFLDVSILRFSSIMTCKSVYPNYLHMGDVNNLFIYIELRKPTNIQRFNWFIISCLTQITL